MRSRRRKRRQSGAISPINPPTALPLDPATEIEQSIEARDKLEVSLSLFDSKREQARQLFLRSLAVELQTLDISTDRLLARFAVWKSDETRSVEEKDAQQLFLSLLKQRIENFKANSPADAIKALQNIITRLTEERGKPNADQPAINARLGKLGEELKALQIVLPPAPPREPKEREKPPERKAEAKSGSDKSAKK